MWSKLNDKFYTKTTLFSLPLDVTNYRVEIGHLMALYKQSLQFYTYDGKLLSTFKDAVQNMKWQQMTLVTVSSNYVRYYDGREYQQYSLEQTIIDSVIKEQQVYLILDTLEIMILNRESKRLLDITLASTPLCWDVISSDILLSSEDGLISTDGLSLSMVLPKAELVAVSPNNQFIAIYDGIKVLVTSSQYETLLEFKIDAPTDIKWCGNDSVLLLFDDLLLLLGPSGDWIKYSYSRVYTTSRGAILLSDQVEYLYKLDDSVVDTFLVGSTSPSSLLLDAYERYLNKESVYSVVKSINIDHAINALLKSVDYEPRKVLEAVWFGQAFTSEQYDIEQICRRLRVMNQLREVGALMLTSDYSPTRAIDLLCLINHDIALAVCKYLKVSQKKVILDWCKYHLDETLEVIVNKARGVSFADVAKVYYDNGRPAIASLLVEYETSKSKQIPLLLSMGEYSSALSKVVDADTDLLYVVLLHLKRKLSISDYYRILPPTAAKLLEKYLRYRDISKLEEYFYQDDNKYELAMMLYEASLQLPVEERILKLKMGLRLIGDLKEYSFSSNGIDQYAHLLTVQARLERETGSDFLDLTLMETIEKMVELKHPQLSKTQKEFKVSDKRMTLAKLNVYSKQKDFDAIEKLSKRSALPMKYFVRATRSDQIECKKYILRLEIPHRLDSYLKAGLLRDAIEFARQQRNIGWLQRCYDATLNGELKKEIEGYMQQLK